MKDYRFATMKPSRRSQMPTFALAELLSSLGHPASGLWCQRSTFGDLDAARSPGYLCHGVEIDLKVKADGKG